MNINATILGQSIAFVLFVIFCMKRVWKPLINVINERQKKISEDLMSADRIKKDSYSCYSQAKQHINKAKIKAKKIIELAKKHKEQLIDEAKIESELQKNKILIQAKLEIDSERQKAKEELQKQITTLVLKCTEKIIENSLNKKIDTNIINKLISNL